MRIIANARTRARGNASASLLTDASNIVPCVTTSSTTRFDRGNKSPHDAQGVIVLLGRRPLTRRGGGGLADSLDPF